MDIGIVGSGKIGGLVKLWVRAAHKVRFCSRHPAALDRLVAGAGLNPSRGTVEEALAFGEVILLSIPYAGVQQFGQVYGATTGGQDRHRDGQPLPRTRRCHRHGGSSFGPWHRNLVGSLVAGRAACAGFNSVWDRTLAKRPIEPSHGKAHSAGIRATRSRPRRGACPRAITEPQLR
jgi:hypothetical protein